MLEVLFLSSFTLTNFILGASLVATFVATSNGAYGRRFVNSFNCKSYFMVHLGHDRQKRKKKVKSTESKNKQRKDLFEKFGRDPSLRSG